MKHPVHYRAAVCKKIEFPMYLQLNTTTLFQVKDPPEITNDYSSEFSVFF